MISIRKDECGRGKAYLFVILLLVVLYLFPETFVAPLGKFLRVQDQLEKSDAIIVLLGADTPDRVFAAEELYHRGLAPKIMFGTGFVDKEYETRAPKGFQWEGSGNGVKRALLSLNVPEADIIMVDSSNAYDTSGELSVISEEVRRLGMHHVILVTSATHSRRTKMVWHRLQNSGVAGDIFAGTWGAPDSRLDTWWRYGRSVRSVCYEYAAMVKELLRTVIG